MSTFDFIFEELPLVLEGTIQACLISGEVTIEYDSAGLWEVNHVTLDGFTDGKPIQVTAPPMLHALVIERLYGAWHDKVQEIVSEQVDLDRERAADDHADVTRERRYDRP